MLCLRVLVLLVLEPHAHARSDVSCRAAKLAQLSWSSNHRVVKNAFQLAAHTRESPGLHCVVTLGDLKISSANQDWVSFGKHTIEATAAIW